MSTKYSPERKTIGDLLSMTNPPIVVPQWQRSFSWSTSEVETYWNDINSFSDAYPDNNIDSEEYFVGSVVIVDNGAEHLLLDGQQRLATSAILLSVIRDFLARNKADAATRLSNKYLTDIDDSVDKRIFKLTLNNYDEKFFRREALETRDGEYCEPDPEYDSHRKIRKAREFFIRKFEAKYAELNNPTDGYNWALRIQKVLTRHVSVVAVISADEDNAANVFETLNDRGIGLSTPDLLKNLVLRRASDGTLKEIIDLWGEVLSVESDVKIDQFLRHFWLSRQGDVKTQSLYREIKRKVIDKKIDSLTFSRDLAKESGVYHDICRCVSEDEQVIGLLQDVKELGATVLYPAILSGFIAAENGELVDYLRGLVNTFVRYKVIGGLDNSRLEDVLYGLAKDFRNVPDVGKTIEKLREIAPNDEQFSDSFKIATVGRIASASVVFQ